MSDRLLTAISRELLLNMSDQELASTLHDMAAAGGTTNGSKLAVICQALARILDKFADGEVVYERDEFAIGESVMFEERRATVVGYDVDLRRWVIRDGQGVYSAQPLEAIAKPT